ncbi:MAG: TM2 domain-containing protein [Alistipes sp.]
MDRNQIDLFIAMNASKFEPAALMSIKQTLEKMSDDKILALSSLSYYDPTLILVIAILLGWERLFLDDIILGVLKILTCYGFGIWWLIDLFTATHRAKQYNYNYFQQTAARL